MGQNDRVDLTDSELDLTFVPEKAAAHMVAEFAA